MSFVPTIRASLMATVFLLNGTCLLLAASFLPDVRHQSSNDTLTEEKQIICSTIAHWLQKELDLVKNTVDELFLPLCEYKNLSDLERNSFIFNELARYFSHNPESRINFVSVANTETRLRFTRGLH